MGGGGGTLIKWDSPMNCGVGYGDMLTNCWHRKYAPSLAPWLFLVEHVEMSVEGNIDSHWKVWLHNTRGMRLDCSLVFL